MNRPLNDAHRQTLADWNAEDCPDYGSTVLSDSLHALLNAPALLDHEAGQALPPAWVERLFSHMEALYGQQFHAQWRDIDPQRMCNHWGAELSMLTARQLRRGIEGLTASIAAPNLPQFLRLCRPALDAHAAYYEAVAGVVAREQGALGEWSDPSIYWAATAIGAFDLKTLPYAQLKRRWEAALAAELAHPHTEPIPAPVPVQVQAGTVADRCRPPRSPNAARKAVAELHASIAQSRTGGPDHKRWARRIQSRIAEGDESVTELQANVAKQALE
jgi:hypothetical protein